MKPESEKPPQSDAATPSPETPDTSETAEPSKGSRAKGAKKDDAATPSPETAAPATLSADEVMPEAHGRRDGVALALLFDACERFNINPSATVRPRELASWRYYPADVLEQRPAAVVVVTAGGLKLKYFAGDVEQDPDTEERLRAIFRAWKVDPVTKQEVTVPLPTDLSLPAECVLGLTTATAHRHPQGYLRRGR